MIKSGIKTEEYREIKPYYTSRFGFIDEDGAKTYLVATYIKFRNGYSKKSPTIECFVNIQKGYGKQEWGAEPNKLYYVLTIKKVIKICE